MNITENKYAGKVPQTCADFVEHPHKVNAIFTSGTTGETFERVTGCYLCQEASASESQGTSEIAHALIDAGIERVQVEQTGGFCMVVYVYNETKTKAICLVSWGVLFCDDVENGGGDSETDISGTYSVNDDLKLTPENLSELVAIVKANLYRLA